MPRGPEGKYIDKIHRQLKKIPDIYMLKMNMGMGAPGGIPDMWYEGKKSNIWVEYKYITLWDHKETIPWQMLSPLQKQWLQRTSYNNTDSYIIFGDSNGNGMLFSAQDMVNHVQLDLTHLRTPKQMASTLAGLIQ